MESATDRRSLSPLRKASLPSLAYGLALLGSGRGRLILNTRHAKSDAATISCNHRGNSERPQFPQKRIRSLNLDRSQIAPAQTIATKQIPDGQPAAIQDDRLAAGANAAGEEDDKKPCSNDPVVANDCHRSETHNPGEER